MNNVIIFKREKNHVHNQYLYFFHVIFNIDFKVTTIFKSILSLFLNILVLQLHRSENYEIINLQY